VAILAEKAPRREICKFQLECRPKARLVKSPSIQVQAALVGLEYLLLVATHLQSLALLPQQALFRSQAGKRMDLVLVGACPFLVEPSLAPQTQPLVAAV